LGNDSLIAKGEELAASLEDIGRALPEKEEPTPLNQEQGRALRQELDRKLAATRAGG